MNYRVREHDTPIELSDEEVTKVAALSRVSDWMTRRYLHGGGIGPAEERVQEALDDLELKDPWETDRR